MPLDAMERDPFGFDAPVPGEEDGAADLDQMSALRDLKEASKEEGFELELQQMQEPIDQTRDVMSE